MEWLPVGISLAALVFTGIAATSAWVQARIAVRARADAEAHAGEARSQAARALAASEASAVAADRTASALETANLEASKRFQTLIEQATDDLLQALSGFMSVELSSSPIGPALERLRNSMLMVVERLEEPDVVAAWFDAERAYALGIGWECQRRVDLIKNLDQTTVQELVDAQAPLHMWARDLLGNVRLWRVGKVTDSQLREQTASLSAVTKPASEWE
jgi:hypothetical protein